jgi:tetratricopeptide (TPR) repeat protein
LWDICWRLGAYLEYSLPDGLQEADILSTLDLSLAAAKRVDSTVGVIRVLIARATVLTSFEHYDEAFGVLASAEECCNQLGTPAMASFAGGFCAAIHKKRADAWNQLADYSKSCEEAMRALELAQAAGDQLQIDRATLLLSELQTVMGPRGEPAVEVPATVGGHSFFSGALAYDARLRAAEAARRSRDTDAAERELRQALRQNYGHARRAASVRYRLARLFLDQAYLATDASGRERLYRQSVAFSGGALNNFIQMGNVIGQMRARCLLARSLAGAGRLEAARGQLQIVKRSLHQTSDSEPSQFLKPIIARFALSQGEYLCRNSSYADASDQLSDASVIFSTLGDHWSSVTTLRLLGTAYRRSGRYAAANAIFWQLADLVGADPLGVHNALTELQRTARQMGHEATALDLQACVGGRSVSGLGRAVWSLIEDVVGRRDHKSCFGPRVGPPQF